MTEMGERVAEAIANALVRTSDGRCLLIVENDDAKEIARAAIEAMREPTKEQSTAGYQFLLDDSSKNGYDRTDDQKLERMRGYYRAMIDAALAKEPA